MIANALPAFACGVMLEEWGLGEKEDTAASAAEFHERLVSRLEPHQPPPEDIAEAVFSVWRKELPPHKAKQVAEKLPDALRPLWAG